MEFGWLRLCFRSLLEKIRFYPAPVENDVQYGHNSKNNPAAAVQKFKYFAGKDIVQESHQDLIDKKDPQERIDYLQ